MSYKTTKSDFDRFTKEVYKWQKFFGLLDWEIKVLHKKLDNARADFFGNIPAKVAVISLDTKWEYPPDKKEIEKCAFHEVCELLLSQLRFFGNGMYDKIIIDEQIHYVIRTLENSVFK